MPKTTIINNLPINFQSGNRTFGPANIPDGATEIRLTFSRCTTLTPTLWPNATTELGVQIQISLDNGNSWRDNNFAAFIGGIITDSDGSEFPSSYINAELPAGTNRKARAIVSVINGPLVSVLNGQVV